MEQIQPNTNNLDDLSLEELRALWESPGWSGDFLLMREKVKQKIAEGRIIEPREAINLDSVIRISLEKNGIIRIFYNQNMKHSTTTIKDKDVNREVLNKKKIEDLWKSILEHTERFFIIPDDFEIYSQTTHN